MKGYLSKFFYVLSGRRRQLALLMLFAVVSSVLEALGLGMIGPFIAVATDAERNRPLIEFMSQQLGSVGLKNASDDQIRLFLGGAVILAFYIKSILGFSVQRYIHRFGAMQRRWIAARLMYSYSRAPYTYHLKHNSAELVQTVVNETEIFSQMALLPLLFAVSNVLIILTIVTLLMVTNAYAVFAVAGIVGVAFGLLQQFKTRISQWGHDRTESFEESIRVLNDSFGGVKEIRVLGCEPYFEQQVDREFKRYAISGSSFYAFSNLPRYLMEAFLITFLVIFTWAFLAFDKGNSGSLNAVLGIFAMSSIRLLPCVGTVIGGTSQVRYAGSALDKIYFALKELEAIPDANILSLRSSPETWMGSRPAIPVMSFQDQVEVSNIVYHYPDIPDPALDQVSFTFRKGEAIALIGRSGAGKTTLVDLILGLLTPETGDIKVDGVSIYGQLRSWQHLVGYVPQSIYLTEDSLLRNVAFGVPDHLIDHEQMQRALEAAQLLELVERLPQGVNTVVGERGMRLSGGQRQRVGIARALYHDRQILILDEATAALDNETESLVSDAVKALGGQKTLIIIAHRLTTIKHCDRVYLMDAGKIIKTGSYESVVLEQGLANELDKAGSDRSAS
jgi:ATP-binding cassette, subfamily B, bacterial PglK